MAHVLEQGEQAAQGVRRWFLLNQLQGSRSVEAPPKRDLWDALSMPVANRRGVARAFADAANEKEGVVEVWLTNLVDDLDVAVVLDDPELESELRDIFIDLVCERLDPREGELYVFPAESVPAWVQNGMKLS